MGLLEIDKSKCKKDGICEKECPAAIIRLADGDGYPDTVLGGENLCLVCGHCVVVCQQGALTHKQITFENCPAIKKSLIINEDQAVQFLRSRRSVRLYKDKPVEKEKIQRLIEVACHAPTAGNRQMLEWLVVSDRSKIRKLAGLTIDWLRQALKDDPRLAAANPYLPTFVAAWDAGRDSVLRDAPVLVAASAPREAVNGMVDVTLALSYADLLAPTMGLGTCWAGLLQRALLSSPTVKDVLGIPDRHPYHYALMLGYPKAKYYRLPQRRPPRITFE